MVTCCAPFALIRPAFPEMISVAVLPAPRVPGVVLMPFTLNDSFDDFAREHHLPDCAVSFLSRAGTWSARASKSGFAPSTMHAEFSDDSDQAVRVLLAAGAVRRVKAGIRFNESPCWTLVNAKDVSRDNERRQAEAEELRAHWRGKKQRQRSAVKAEQRKRIASGVPPLSPGTNADVPPENPGNPKKRQVNGTNVPGDIGGTSPGTAKKTASDYQDPSQSSGVGAVGVDLINTRAREGPSPETLAFVVARISKKRKRPVSEDEARRAIGIWDRRAEAAGKVIHEPEKFYPTCVERERDLEAILAPPLPAAPPEWLELGRAQDPAPGAHLFEPTGNPFDTACSRAGCGLPEKNTRVHVPEAKTG